METLILIGVVVVLLALAMLAMGIKVLLHRTHKFPETSAGHNPNMRRMGITCPRHEEIKQWKTRPDDKTCATCYEHARE